MRKNDVAILPGARPLRRYWRQKGHGAKMVKIFRRVGSGANYIKHCAADDDVDFVAVDGIRPENMRTFSPPDVWLSA